MTILRLYNRVLYRPNYNVLYSEKALADKCGGDGTQGTETREVMESVGLFSNIIYCRFIYRFRGPKCSPSAVQTPKQRCRTIALS